MTIDLLAIAPHPDDAEFFCGGLLAKMSQANYSVGILDLTQGELGTRGSVVERMREAELAKEILGLSFRENVALPDGALQAANKEQEMLVVKALRRIGPKVVLIPHCNARHPDHVEAAGLLKRALFFAALTKYEPALGEAIQAPIAISYQMRFEFEPSFVTDISEVYHIKEQAFQAYASQIAPAEAQESKTLLSSKLNLSSLRARDAYYGAKIGVAFGEGYKVTTPLSLSDPIDYFQNTDLKRALFFK